MEAGESDAQSQPQLRGEIETLLSYIKPCLKTNEKLSDEETGRSLLLGLPSAVLTHPLLHVRRHEKLP